MISDFLLIYYELFHSEMRLKKKECNCLKQNYTTFCVTYIWNLYFKYHTSIDELLLKGTAIYKEPHRFL